MGAIARMCMANGGKVSGPGTGTSDSIAIKASAGEYVMPADSVKKIGRHVLDLLRIATHKPVNPKQGAIRKMADGGYINEDWRATDAMGNGANIPAPPPVRADTNYMQQAADVADNAARSTVTGLGEGANTIFRTGINSLVNPPAPAPAPAAANPTDQRMATGTQEPPVTPALPAADASMPTLRGMAGTAVASAPGVSKFTGTDGRTLYSNVAGTESNDALMNRGAVSPINLLALNGIQARQDAGDTARANAAQLKKEEADAIATNAQGGFGTGEANTTDPRTMILRQLQGKKLTLKGMAELSNVMTNDVSAGQLSIAQQKLGLEAPTEAAKAQLSISTLAARQAYAKALNSGNPQEVEKAANALRGIEGKWERTVNPVRPFAVPGGTFTDSSGQVQHMPSQVYDPDTGEFKTAPSQKPQPQFESGKTYQDAKGNKAKWDGTKFVPA